MALPKSNFPEIFQSKFLDVFRDVGSLVGDGALHAGGAAAAAVITVSRLARLSCGVVELPGATLQPLQILQSPPPTPRLNRSRPGSGHFAGEFVRRRLLLLLADAVGRGNGRLCCCSVS